MRVRSRHKSNRQRLVQIVILSLLLILVGMMVPRLVSVVSAVVMAPVHGVNSWLDKSTSLVPVFIRDRLALQSEIKELKNQTVIAGRNDLTQQRLQAENNRLRELLGANTESRIAAAVIARPDELPYDILQIDRGSADGIEVGAPVFVGSDVVIGLVVHTSTHYSFVELITTSGFEATAFIAGPDVVVMMEGVGGGVARVRVPQGVPLMVGNLVHLPSVEPGVFGRISYVENQPTQPEQYGYISPDISVASLFQVAVGKVSQISRSADEIDDRILEEMRKQLLVENVTVGTISTSTENTPTTSLDIP